MIVSPSVSLLNLTIPTIYYMFKDFCSYTHMTVFFRMSRSVLLFLWIMKQSITYPFIINWVLVTSFSAHSGFLDHRFYSPSVLGALGMTLWSVFSVVKVGRPPLKNLRCIKKNFLLGHIDNWKGRELFLSERTTKSTRWMPPIIQRGTVKGRMVRI